MSIANESVFYSQAYRKRKGCGVAWLAILAIVFAGHGSTLGQDNSADDEELLAPVPMEFNLEPGTPEEIAELESRFNQTLEKLRELLAEARQAEIRFRFGQWEESDHWNEQWQSSQYFGKFVRRELERSAYYLLFKSAQPDQRVLDICQLSVGPLYDEFQYEMVFRIADEMKRRIPDDEAVRRMRARAAILTNRFVEAEEELELIQQYFSELPPFEVDYFKKLRQYADQWQQEQAIRNAEAEADDLPRVELLTSDGRIVLELFEDQYPETVGNFIHLVEGGFYNNVLFHRVAKNFLPLSIAQTGSASFTPGPTAGTFEGAPKVLDYNIYDETPKGPPRRHWRGVVSMMKRYSAEGKPIPNSASSDFIILLTPAPLLDDELVPFGRVISDLEVIDRIRVNIEIDPKEGKEKAAENPDYTLVFQTKVIRKRDRDYQPHKVQ